MSTELKEYIRKCDVCMSYRNAPSKEPLQPHEFVARPWSKVRAELCQLDGRMLFVISDFYSNYIELARLTLITSKSIIKELNAVFARHGIPDVLVTDNGPQFTSAEFAVFTRTWTFDHKTSSPSYAQSNGKAENAVKTIERLFQKCKASGQSKYLALLDWRNTPTKGVDTSPAQRLMGRRCKTLFPMAGTLLQPRYDSKGEAQALAGTKQRQQFYCNRHAKPLKELSPGKTVRMKLPGRERWTPGVCTEKVDNTEYRRNRRYLLKTDEPALAEPADSIDPVAPASDDNFHLELGASDEHSFTEPSGPRRSERTKQVSAWHKDYELSRRAYDIKG